LVWPYDELDAALILSGYVDHRPHGRYCFQTTFVDECYREYYQPDVDYKLIWVLRNPFSVVFSLLYNWPKSPLDRTFHRCGATLLRGSDRWLYKLFGLRYIDRTYRGCLIYNYKVAQLGELVPRLGTDKVMVVDYDQLVQDKETVLPQIYGFIELPYKDEYAGQIHASSLSKANRLSERETSTVKKLCEPVYAQARHHLTQLEF
jgi:hypothetical protein